MRSVRQFLLVIILAMPGLPVSGNKTIVGAQSLCSYDFSPVTNLIQGSIGLVPLDGASLILIKDGQVVYEKYFGNYNANTTVFIASASKWLSGATLMTQVDAGRISLDDPVSKHLPYFTGVNGTMTIRQMFSHTAGYAPESALTSNEAECIGNRFTTMDACAREIAQLKLIANPGAQFAYGSNSMQAAGRVCEVVSGKSWEVLFQENIAGPLGMTATTFGQGGNPLVPGGARSRLRDYANFLQMIANRGTFNGRRILSENSVREMQKDQTFGVPIFYSPHSRYGNANVRYGIGEWLDVTDAEGNSIQVSSQGAFGFSPWLDKKRNLIGVFLVQNQLQNVYSTVAQIQQAVRQAIDACANPVSGVSAASYLGTALAPESINAAFGVKLANTTTIAETTPLPKSLAETSMRIIDAAGSERLAPMFFASPNQINFLIPAETVPGAAKITVTGGDGSLSIGDIQIAAVAPGIFTADASGQGLAAATVLRVKADGSQVYEPVARFDSATSRIAAVPIEVGVAGEQVYLILYGTGLRRRSSLQSVSVSVGGTFLQALYAGAQGSFIGLDQVNVLLPGNLSGRGEVEVVLTVDGKTANTVKISLK